MDVDVIAAWSGGPVTEAGWPGPTVVCTVLHLSDELGELLQ